MFSENLRFTGFSSATWIRLLGLLGYQPRSVEQPHLVVIEGAPGHAIAAFTTRGEIIKVREYTGPTCLAALCDRHGCKSALMLRDGVIAGIVEDVSARLQGDGDLLDHVIAIATGLRDAALRGELAQYPQGRGLPVPTATMVRRAVDHVLPESTSLVIGVWDRRTLWTGVVLRRRQGRVDLCAGPEAITEWVGPLGGDFHRDHRSITRAVAGAVAPVHLGLYAERDQLQRLLRSPSAGSWLKAVALREVVFDPAPAYVNVALGADGARAAASQLKTLLGGFDAFQRFQPYLGAARDQLGTLGSVTRLLGFNPLERLATQLTADQSADEPLSAFKPPR